MTSPSRVEPFLVVCGALVTLIASVPALADLVFTSQPPIAATVGQAYSYTMTATSIPDDDDDDDDNDDDDDDNGHNNESRRLRFIARALPNWLEFDGNDTIFGTPGPEDVGAHRVRLRARTKGGSDDQDFSITVVAAPGNAPSQGADLAASVTVAPNPVGIAAPAAWTVTARNVSDTDVANAVLETVFSGDATFEIEDVDDESCSVEPRGADTAVTCRWAPLSGGESKSAMVTGRASEAGEIVAVATVSIADSSPADRNPGNDDARVALSVAEVQSGGPAQELSARGAAAVAVEDFNNDSRDDLAVATGAGEPTLVFLNDPDGDDARPFTAVPISAGAETFAGASIAAGDLDGDGDADIVVANSDGPNQVLFNNGSAGFETVTLEVAAGGSRGVAIADVDGDSLPDIVLANEDLNIVYRSLGNREFSGENVGAASSAAVIAVDLIGDALPELVFANRDRNAEIYARADGNYTEVVVLETGSTTSAAAADFDADGDADLAFGRDAADLVLLNTSGASASFSTAGQIGETATVAVLTGDFDLDGRNDFVSIGASGAHRLYANDGAIAPSFLAGGGEGGPGGGFSGKAATGAASGLFDAGGALDVAVAVSDVVAVFLNVGGPDSGGTPLGAPLLTLVGESTMTITVGESYQDPGATALDDVDGDLTAQILVDNPVDTNVIGRYSVTYEVVDSAGNLTTATRIVEVQARSPSGGGGGGAAGPVLLWLLAGCMILARSGRLRGSASAKHVTSPAELQNRGRKSVPAPAATVIARQWV